MRPLEISWSKKFSLNFNDGAKPKSDLKKSKSIFSNIMMLLNNYFHTFF